MAEQVGGAPPRRELEEGEEPDKGAVDDDERKKKPFEGFVEKVLLLVIGFALTTALGGYLTNQYRRETAKTEFEIASMQSDISRSIEVFQSISQLMDKRLFRMRRLHDVFNGNVGAEAFDQRLDDYRASLIEWNDNLNRNRALYAFYFPQAAGRPTQDVDCGSSFEAIRQGFTDSHNELQKLIDKKPEGAPQKVQTMLDDLNVCIYILDEGMLLHIADLRAAYKEKLANQ